MVNRRQFVGTGLAASVAGALVGIPWSPSGAGGERFPGDGLALRALLIDERFDAARRIGGVARNRGLAVYAFRGDVTHVWYARLDPLWKREPAAIAGCTAYAALFCLERLAWDRGLRVVERGEYRDGDGRPLHAWAIAPRGALRARRA